MLLYVRDCEQRQGDRIRLWVAPAVARPPAGARPMGPAPESAASCCASLATEPPRSRLTRPLHQYSINNAQVLLTLKF